MTIMTSRPLARQAPSTHQNWGHQCETDAVKELRRPPPRQERHLIAVYQGLHGIFFVLCSSLSFSLSLSLSLSLCFANPCLVFGQISSPLSLSLHPPDTSHEGGGVQCASRNQGDLSCSLKFAEGYGEIYRQESLQTLAVFGTKVWARLAYKRLDWGIRDVPHIPAHA
ncbi:uncharacterized protein LY79DRAFT_249064 [Colletotrichum navitas]|uniref:Uncharacterized protein n=1 Tax=Colletotrichum navitas TaxID=681940 RepID=A0AAD8QAR6_9PEZI|nr:uncharacterized protein LY79DRAFT_249064 [Colletotrichum navitas]KAK1598601.1 hypothetical protein LY79DRAFT_249064 [Colletotrichum navitas]